MTPALLRARRGMMRAIRAPLRSSLVERVLRRYTLGRPFSGLAAHLLPTPEQYPRGSVRRCDLYGLRYEVDLSDLMGWYVYFGFRDPSTDAYVGLLKEGQVVVDVGANQGATVMRAARAVGPRGRVIGLEPDPDNFARCQHHVRLNALDNVELVRVGLSDESRRAALVSPNAANSGMKTVATGDRPDGVEIELRTLDALVLERGLDRIDVLKIDVEGLEPQVLRGGATTLARYRPILFIELNDPSLVDHGSSAGNLVELLCSLGYELTDAETGHPVRGGDPLDRCLLDLVCYPR